MAELKLDCLGDMCPVPLVKTQKNMNSIKLGDSLKVTVDHSCAMKNVPDWAIRAGHKVKINEKEGQWEILIEKVK